MNKLALYFRLVRLDKPIGILLLLWPTLCALWMASNGKPDWTMSSASSLGTAADALGRLRHQRLRRPRFDKHVKRTATGR
jgi:4-hydroxybenzoate polyprenyltransferase